MEQRREQLRDLKTYIKGIDDEVSTILQTLEWDRKQLLQSTALVACKYDANHKIPPDKTEEHEKECVLRQNGYSKEDQFLPDPLDLESDTLVKLSNYLLHSWIIALFYFLNLKHECVIIFMLYYSTGKEDIEKIITTASKSDELFKKGVGSHDAEPLTLARLLSTYSGDERRAIHDAVVSAVPSCHDLTDLALLSGEYDTSSTRVLSRQEILRQLRNMRRRPAKYRVAAKSRNYSDVLRDVIKTQMEHYSDAQTQTAAAPIVTAAVPIVTAAAPNETVENVTNQEDTHDDMTQSQSTSKHVTNRNDGKTVPEPIKIKTEREDSTERNYRDNYQRDFDRGRTNKPYRYRMGSRDGRDRDYGRRDRSRERRDYRDKEKSGKYGEYSRKKRYDDEFREKRNYNKESEKEFWRKLYEKRSSKRLKDFDLDTSNRRRDTSRERRRDEKRDKGHTHKGKKDRRRDRERSKERRSDYRYEWRSSQEIQIKQEREDSEARDETEDRRHESNKRRRDRSDGDDRSCDRQSIEIKEENLERYYDMLSEDYDPNKKIKEEK
ncbi:hypothetical protein PYW08_003526 [Mythimna loreyi]|uniref:Uncharacterized protein n=1 Tax=Mythimna loreyi TaxID=667449 RepID=A0ACC2QST1_9NEOP|nr:hypothetical protein PYW08_003526 [Mythimna loreyi]